MRPASIDVIETALAAFVSDYETRKHNPYIDEARRLLSEIRARPSVGGLMLWAELHKVIPFESEIGELALVKCPPNVFVAPDEPQRLLALIAAADQVAKVWRSQDGVSGSLLDALAAAVEARQ